MNNPIIENELSNNLSRISINNEFIADEVYKSSAELLAKALYERIVEFQSKLSCNEDVGVAFVRFDITTILLIESIDYIGNNLVVFHGKDTNDNPLELIQHISQLNFLLTVVHKSAPEVPKRQIGFRTNYDDPT